MDATLLTGGIITAILFLTGGALLFAYNHYTRKERRGDD